MPEPQLTPAAPRARRTLAACCSAHALHDGYSDTLYVLFPIWQASFGLSFAEVGMLKTLYSGTLAALQVPAGMLAERCGERRLLVVGTLIAACAFVLMGWSAGFLGLALCLALGGAGASVQHPLGSTLTSRAFDGANQRAAIGTFNFSGDIGKVALPALCAALLASLEWRQATVVLGGVGLAGALILGAALPPRHPASARPGAATDASRSRPARLAQPGFLALSAIGVIDSATRMGFLTLLPFVLIAKGATVTQAGFALSLTFAGGAAGKFVCGLIAARAGVLRTTVLTELASAAGIVAVLPLDLEAAMALLPLVGVVLNGTSSVLYGSVADLVPAERRARAFGVYYTFTIGSGAVAPVVYGLLGDVLGIATTYSVIAATVLLTLPLTLVLRPALRTAS